MRLLAMILIFCLTAFNVTAGHHEGEADFVTMKKRQPDSVMTVTSVKTGAEVTTITATGKMGEYGKVYVTYNLSLNADRTGGFVDGNGRGFIDENNVAAGFFKGIWSREGSKVKMNFLVNMADGSQNYDVVIFDAREDTLTHSVYVVK